MKLSEYNIFMKRNNVVLGYNTMLGSILMLSNSLYNFFEDNRNNLDNIKESNTELFDNLYTNGFIIDKNFDELSKIRLDNKLDCVTSKNYHLTIIPSLDCNLKCWYCFENHRENSQISDKIVNSILKHIEVKIENGELGNLVLEWFGGEPLLFFDEKVYPLSIRLKKLLGKNNMVLHSFFVTNGTLITDEHLKKLNEINSKFQITLDGCQEKHDKVRRLKNSNNGTYKQLIETIYKLSETLDNTFINVRINYDNKTLEGFESILNDLSGVNKKKVKFHLERIWQTKPTPNNQLLKKSINQALAMGFSVSYLKFFKKNYACKVDRLNQATILYDGSVYKCSGRDFKQNEIDGILNEDGIIDWKTEKVEKRIGLATFENELCLKCNFLPVCMGPCSQKLMENNWTNVKKICELNNLELTLDDYLVYLFNNIQNIKKNNV